MRPGDQDPFFQYPQATANCSAGEVPLPIRYFDASSLVALFPVGVERAMELLRGSGTRPVPLLGRKALAGIALFDYRDTDIGPYREVGLVVAALPQDLATPPLAALNLLRGLDQRRAGFHIVDLPVTTGLSNAAGRELWGYPKFLADIDFSLQGRRFRGGVHAPDGGGEIFSLSGPAGFGVPLPAPSLVLYSRREDRLLRTVLNARARFRLAAGGQLRLRVGAGSQPMAEHLQQLGLDGASPLAVVHTHKLQARLNPGAIIASLATPG